MLVYRWAPGDPVDAMHTVREFLHDKYLEYDVGYRFSGIVLSMFQDPRSQEPPTLEFVDGVWR